MIQRIGTPTWVLLVVACVLAGNMALYLRVASRLNDLEALLARTDGARNEGLVRGTSMPTPLAGIGSGPPKRGELNPANSPAARMIELKRKAIPDSIEIAAQMDQLFSQEPSIPELEQKQLRWLDEALDHLADDAPSATGVQTSCRGRRCLVSAVFKDESDARDWAGSYFRATRGTYLKHARIVTVPLGGDGQSMGLQLHLY